MYTEYLGIHFYGVRPAKKSGTLCRACRGYRLFPEGCLYVYKRDSFSLLFSPQALITRSAVRLRLLFVLISVMV